MLLLKSKKNSLKSGKNIGRSNKKNPSQPNLTLITHNLDISRAVNSSFVRFNIIFKKKNLLNQIMNIQEKNQSFKTTIQFFINTNSLKTVFSLFNSS